MRIAKSLQICNKFGDIDQNNRESQSVFVCTKCQYKHNADLNAALDILAVGQAASACRDIRQIAA